MSVLSKEKLVERHGEIVCCPQNVECTLICDDCDHMGEMMYKLAEYEDLEEQGLLLRLPCKINQDIYFVPSETNFKLNILNNMSENNRVYHQRICHIVYDGNGYYLECDKELEYGTGRVFIDRHYGEIWFLSKSEAEEKLRELEEK